MLNFIDFYLLLYICIGLLCGFCTVIIGKNRDIKFSFIWGLLLGPLGILIVSLRPYKFEIELKKLQLEHLLQQRTKRKTSTSESTILDLPKQTDILLSKATRLSVKGVSIAALVVAALRILDLYFYHPHIKFLEDKTWMALVGIWVVLTLYNSLTSTMKSHQSSSEEENETEDTKQDDSEN